MASARLRSGGCSHPRAHDHEPSYAHRQQVGDHRDLIVAPGARYDYSNTNTMLGVVLEQVSGKPLRDYLRGEIIDPLGLTSTDEDI